MVLEQGVGDVPVTVQSGNDGPRSTRMSVPRMPERGPAPPSRADLAAMLSLSAPDLLPGHVGWSCGVPFLFLAWA
jgi:predicted PhzF superfamily epimerase YddE/YHI9